MTEKVVLVTNNFILTSQWHAEHPLAGRNTQQVVQVEGCLVGLLDGVVYKVITEIPSFLSFSNHVSLYVKTRLASLKP